MWLFSVPTPGRCVPASTRQGGREAGRQMETDGDRDCDIEPTGRIDLDTYARVLEKADKPDEAITVFYDDAFYNDFFT